MDLDQWTTEETERVCAVIYASKTPALLDTNIRALSPFKALMHPRDRDAITAAYGKTKRRLERQEKGRPPSTAAERLASEIADGSGQGTLFDAPSTSLEFLRCDESFEIWWSRYPKKVERPKVLRKWRTLWRKAELPTLRQMLDALELHRVSRQWKDGFIPNPHTYLNGGRWGDELEPWNPYAHERDASARALLIDSDMCEAQDGKEAARLRILAWEAWRRWGRKEAA